MRESSIFCSADLKALLACAIINLDNERVMIMASLSVRKLDTKVYNQLRVRALKHGLSMEEEARQIISQAVSAPERISDVFLKYFGTKKGIDLDTSAHRKPHNPMEFDE